MNFDRLQFKLREVVEIVDNVFGLRAAGLKRGQRGIVVAFEAEHMTIKGRREYGPFWRVSFGSVMVCVNPSAIRSCAYDGNCASNWASTLWCPDELKNDVERQLNANRLRVKW